MKEIKLKPIKETTADYEQLESFLKKFFKEHLYYPILKELNEPKKAIKNSIEDLARAIQKGRITFYRGTFSGKLNATLTKELRKLGARYDRREGAYKINASELPHELRANIAASEARFKQRMKGIDEKLRQILPAEIADKVQISKFFDRSLWKVDREFRKSVEGITIAPELSDEQRKKIADEWQTNMQLYIKDFTEKEIVKLREDLQASVFKGDRYESAISAIQKSYGVSANKAKFLARQETSLLMTKFKETRYVEAGVDEYIWKCVHMPKDKNPKQNTPGNVRYSHGILDGKKFKWNNPPNTANPGEAARHNNPGQDYNCRCYAIPVVSFRSK